MNRKKFGNKDLRWNLSSVYGSQKELTRDWRCADQLLLKIKNLQNDITNLNTIFKFILLLFKAKRLVEKIVNFTKCKAIINLNNGKAVNQMQAASSLEDNLEKLKLQCEEKILALPKELLIKLYSFSGLKDYSNYLDILLQKKKESVIKNSKAIAEIQKKGREPFRKFEKTLQAMKFSPVICEGQKTKLSYGTFPKLLQNSNRETRHQAFKNYLGKFASVRDKMSQSIIHHIKNQIKLAKAKGYDNPLPYLISQNNIPLSAYQNLISTAEQSLPDLHTYHALKKQVLKLNELRPYDLYVPLFLDPKPYPFKSAVNIIYESLKILGDDYAEKAKKILTEKNWVDLYERKGKRKGGMSIGGYDNPPFILVNYNNTFESLLLLTHELGHSMHTCLATESQSYPKWHYGYTVADIAASFHEQALISYLIKNAAKGERVFYLNQWLESIRTTFFRQTMFAEFELCLYKQVQINKSIGAHEIENEYRKIFNKYAGSDIILDENIQYEWSRIQHFYFNFFTFNYSIGQAASIYFLEKVSQSKNEVNNYLWLLSAGGSKSQTELLGSSGLDITKSHYLKILTSRFKNLIAQIKEQLKT